MKNIKPISLSLLFLLLISSFSAFSQAPEPEEGKGLIVFYRPKAFSGKAIKFSIKENEKSFGQLKNGTIIEINTKPGEHTFWSQVISSDAITVNVEEGKVYYIRATTKMGAVAGRPKFNQVDEEKA